MEMWSCAQQTASRQFSRVQMQAAERALAARSQSPTAKRVTRQVMKPHPALVMPHAGAEETLTLRRMSSASLTPTSAGQFSPPPVAAPPAPPPAPTVVLQEQLEKSSNDIAKLRQELDQLKTSASSTAHAIVQRELQTRQVCALLPRYHLAWFYFDLTRSVTVHCEQLELTDGAISMQGRLDDALRDLEATRRQLADAKNDAQSSHALVTALQRVVDDRTQELVVARGQVDSLTALSQKLHEMTVSAASSNDGVMRRCTFTMQSAVLA